MANGKLTLNHANIAAVNHNSKIALEQAADATLTDIISKQVIPFDYGTMQDDQTFVDNNDSASGHSYIVTSAPQALRLYFHPEYDFQFINNPNAKGAWFEDWTDGEFAKKAFASRWRAMNGGLK